MSSEVLGMPGAGIEPARGFPRGIFVLTTAFAAARVRARIWSLDFTFALSRGARVRQGPSSLYTFNAGSLVASRRGLARYCSHRYVLLFHRL